MLRALVGALVALGLVTGCTTLEEKERALTFRVEKRDAGWYSGQPVEVQDVYLPVSAAPDAQRIHAWWWPDADPDAPVVYYLHGVRWNLTGHLRRIEQLRQFGYSVFAIDYRGFGKSDGDLPSEQMVYEDAMAGWKWLTERQPDPARRLIYGHSLGGAVAIDLAAKLAADGAACRPQARGLIVEATFTSLPDVAAELSWSWLPTSLILTQRFDSISKIRTIDVPVLVVHGAGDRFIPAKFSQALYGAAPEPKRLLLVENGSHNNSMWTGNGDYQRALAELFGKPGEAVRARADRAPSSRSC
ncbi:MAG: alpha/beta hydrolase [Burkholderiales bacterium]|nr:alpha/beta hydrolase [Burkholderiales bacterium]